MLARQNRLQELQQTAALQGAVLKGTSHKGIGQLVRLLQDHADRQHFYQKAFSLFFQICSQKSRCFKLLGVAYSVNVLQMVIILQPLKKSISEKVEDLLFPSVPLAKRDRKPLDQFRV